MRDSIEKPKEPEAKIEPVQVTQIVPAPTKTTENLEKQVDLIRNPSELAVNVDDKSQHEELIAPNQKVLQPAMS